MKLMYFEVSMSPVFPRLTNPKSFSKAALVETYVKFHSSLCLSVTSFV